MGLVTKFFSVGSATLASRVLGFVREALIASSLGAGPVADAFYAAFRFPNLFRRLFAEGAFNTAFVPLFAKELEREGRDAARDFAEQVLAALLVALVGLSALAMIFMPALVASVIAPKFSEDPAKFDLTVLLTRIMFPYLTAMSLVAMLSGILNSLRRYFLAALAPVLLNIIFIAVLIGGRMLQLDDRMLGIAMAAGVTVSGAIQLLLLVVGVLREDFGLRLKRPVLSDPVRRLMWLAVPTAIAGGITQVNLLVGQIIASAEPGAISVMNYADRLMQLPLGVIAISIGVVLLPELTRALAARDDREALKLQNRSLEFGLGLTIPAAVGLYMMPVPLIALLYERGAFTRETTEITASVLAAFAIGLPAFVLIKIFQPGFYARQDMKTPMWFAGAGAITNIVASLILFPRIGVAGLGIATSLAGWINAVLLAGTLARRKLFHLDRMAGRNILIVLGASAAMGTLLYFANTVLGDALMDAGLAARLGLVFLVILASAILYFAIVIATGAIPRAQLMRMIRRRKRTGPGV